MSLFLKVVSTYFALLSLDLFSPSHFDFEFIVVCIIFYWSLVRVCSCMLYHLLAIEGEPTERVFVKMFSRCIVRQRGQRVFEMRRNSEGKLHCKLGGQWFSHESKHGEIKLREISTTVIPYKLFTSPSLPLASIIGRSAPLPFCVQFAYTGLPLA